MKFLLSIFLLLLLLYPFKNLLRDKSHLYQLPVLFSITTFFFIVPSLFGQLFFTSYLSDSEYNYFTLNIILCLLASYIGYGFKSNIKIYDRPFNSKKALIVVIPFFLIGLIISYLKIDAQEFGSTDGGEFAIYLFFGRLIRPSIFIILFIHLIKPRKITLVLIILWVLTSLNYIIISGRRSEFFILIITLLLPFFFIKNRIPSKKTGLIVLFFGLGAFVILPVTRTYTRNLNFSALNQISFENIVVDYFNGEKSNEIVEASINMNIVREEEGYSYGARFVNKFNHQFVSSTIFGDEFKSNSKIDTYDLSKNRDLKYNRGTYKGYLANTGYVDTFYDFGFFSFMAFFAFGRIAKVQWVKAYYSNNIIAKAFYSYFTILIFMAVYDSLSFLPILLIQALIIFIPVKIFSK